MSRTYRSEKEGKLKSGKKMKPYVSNKHVGSGKFVAEMGDGLGITTLGKLIAKNANRSLKKTKRQEGKKEIKNYLNN